MQRMSRAFRVPGMKLMAALSAALVLAGIAGCGENAGAGRGKPQELPDGRTFVSNEVRDGAKQRPLASGSRIRLSFDGGELSADAGCNHFGGTARLVDGRLVVEGLGGTEMGCPDALMRQDEWLTAFLTGKPRWSLDGDQLTLTANDAEIRLTDRRVADPDRPLRGTNWVLDTIIDGDTASSVPDGVRTPRLRLTRTRASGYDGCNSFGRGKVQVSGSHLRLSDFVHTLALCTRDDENAVAEAVLSVLDDDDLEYQVEADRLTLTTPEGKCLGFHAE